MYWNIWKKCSIGSLIASNHNGLRHGKSPFWQEYAPFATKDKINGFFSSSRRSVKQDPGGRSKEFFLKNCDFSLWGNHATTQLHISNWIFFQVLPHWAKARINIVVTYLFGPVYHGNMYVSLHYFSHFGPVCSMSSKNWKV